MKIDFHCHTRKIKSGDGVGRDVNPELFREKIIDADVKIVAITNHNCFDYKQYEALKQSVADLCQVWPGVEIDIEGGNGKRWHLIVVANPEKVGLFSTKVQDLFREKDLETCTLSLSQVYQSLNDCDVIYISHFHKKPGLTEQDRQELLNLVNEDSRVFNETSDHRSLGVFANYNYNVLIGSDVKDWNTYEQSNFAELRLPVSNFSQFCLLSKRDPVVVNTLLNNKKSYTLQASPHKSIQFPLKIFEDINVIFGQKGTGKSEILNSLYEEMIAKGVCCVKYTGSEKEDDFNTLLKTKDMEANLSIVGAKGCEEEFAQIFSWVENSPTLFNNYINWYTTRDNNSNKRRMKITESTDLVEPTPDDYQNHTADKSCIGTIVKEISEIELDSYLDQADSDRLLELIDKLHRVIKNMLVADIIQIQSCRLTNFSLDRIKAIADKNSNTVSKPSSTGFREFAKQRFILYKSICVILNNINSDESNDKVKLGKIEEKGTIFMNMRYRMLCKESKAVEFVNNIKPLRDIHSLLIKSKEDFLASDISLILNEVTSKCQENSITSVKSFLGLSKQIIDEDGAEYSPSNGEKGILLLQKILEKEADAYFLDEPELGMGNSYIDMNVRPILSSLARRHKVVVVATHNANIAVRTLPYTSIYRVHINGTYTTYIGNPFNDLLINYSDDEDKRSWTTESLQTLEGGEEAFYERKNIYESKNN